MGRLRRRITVAANLTCLVAAAWVGTGLCTTAAEGDVPKPAAVPYRWELDFESGPLRLFTPRGSSQSYWYFTYYVENNTGDDHVWAPEFTLFTDDGAIQRSGNDVPTSVFEDIKSLLGNDLLEEQNSAIGDLRQGEENAREGLVIWPARSLDVNEVSLFIAGISGETARVRNPLTGDDVIMRKTLFRQYLVPGMASARGNRPAPLEAESWIMR